MPLEEDEDMYRAVSILFLISSAVLATGQSPEPDHPKVQDSKLEYCLHFAGPLEMSSGFSKTLDMYGSEDWDLAAVVGAGTEPRNDISPGHIQNTNYMFVFKRKTGSGAKSCDSIHGT